jgi:RimJ/RimL family protein N-acetyltransferase
MELLTYTDGDLPLTEALECDPRIMRDLGGPLERSEVPRLHARRLAGIAKGDWWLKIVPDAGGPAAGTIGIWETSWKEARIHEIGWMVLPAFQGRGVASAAVALILERARSEPGMRQVHAFPAVSNGPSNALCRKSGFALIGESDFEYRGGSLRCNHWELDVSSPRGAES